LGLSNTGVSLDEKADGEHVAPGHGKASP
jgi:hypothetical protein